MERLRQCPQLEVETLASVQEWIRLAPSCSYHIQESIELGPTHLKVEPWHRPRL